MYTEIVSPEAGAARLRVSVDPKSEWFTDEDLRRIVVICSGMLDRAVVKCLIGIQQLAKDKKDSKSVFDARTFLNRFEAGLINV